VTIDVGHLARLEVLRAQLARGTYIVDPVRLARAIVCRAIARLNLSADLPA
jgi:anti-sigma28 factor (negative regulator of flagellin synthesis)